MQRGEEFLKSLFGRDDSATLSRREALAGLGLVGLVAATAKLIAVSPAEAKPLDQPVAAAAQAAETQVAEAREREPGAADNGDLTDVSSRRHWHRHWHRRHWRRHWHRRRWWRRHYWRRHHWRRHYWRRRYW
jgi:hypothetical protein